MPKLTRWMLRSSMIMLVGSLALALLLSSSRWISSISWAPAVRPVFLHLFTVGWVLQMILGVSFWMFPILGREKPRGNEWIAWTSFALINIGLIIRALAEPLEAIYHSSAYGWLLVASALAQWIGSTTFVLVLWPRVRARGTVTSARRK